jgi:hypothetical protein
MIDSDKKYRATAPTFHTVSDPFATFPRLQRRLPARLVILPSKDTNPSGTQSASVARESATRR